MDLVVPSYEPDWSKNYVDGGDLRTDVTDSKFKLWDYVVENNLLESEDETVRARAYSLLNDDTIYEYAFFYDDFDKPIRYTAYQDLIASYKHDFTPDNPNRYVLFRASNQIGKSRFLIGKSKKIALTEENRNIVMISKSLPQSQYLLSELKRSLSNSKFGDSWREDVGETANTTMLSFEREVESWTGNKKTVMNRIICAPAGEGSLGYPMHYLFLDEADFYEDSKRLFWKVFFARTKFTKGQIILFSNPNPDIPKSSSLLHDLWQGDLFQRKFHFNFLDAPWNTKEEFDRDKRNSPSHVFSSTHLGEWSDEDGAFFKDAEIRDMLQHDWDNRLPIVDRPVYIALDLGKMQDNTVLSVGVVRDPKDNRDKFKDLDVLYMLEFPLKTEYDKILDKLKEIIDHYKNDGYGVARVGYDATGDKTFGDFARSAGVSVLPVDFNRRESNKTKLYNDFKLMAENRKIRIVYTEKCEHQLSNLMFKETESKKYKKIENKTDRIHDDYPDNLSILIHISVRPSTVPVTVTQVKTRDKIVKKHEEYTEEQHDKDVQEYYRKVIQDTRKSVYGGFPF